jgi:hypothetical protein
MSREDEVQVDHDRLLAVLCRPHHRPLTASVAPDDSEGTSME